jgi:hypothetical protein
MELPGTMSVEVAHHRLLRFFLSSWNYNPEAEIWQQIADNSPPCRSQNPAIFRTRSAPTQ